MSNFDYKRLTEDEQNRRGILGRLVGVIADFKNPTRNGRLYSEDVWDHVLEDEVFQEKIQNRCCLGELGHPEDRDEVDIEKAAICLAEMPKKSNDGKLYGVFDILNTPCGKILKSLCDYGCNIGVSSRGNGDVEEDYNGDQSVIPDTYMLECWDAVLTPSVKSARPKYVTESLENKFNRKSLTESLKEVINTSSKDDQKVMNEALANLHITLTSDITDEPTEATVLVDVETDELGNISVSETQEVEMPEDEQPVEMVVPEEVIAQAQEQVNASTESPSEEDQVHELIDEPMIDEVPDDNIPVDLKDEEEADNLGESLLKDLQEALQQKRDLKVANEELKNKLSVGFAKEQELNEAIAQYKSGIRRLVESNKKTVGLSARLTQVENSNDQLVEALDKACKLSKKLSESVKQEKLNSQKREEDTAKLLESKDKKIEEQQNKLLESTNNFNKLKKEYDEKLIEQESQFTKYKQTMSEKLKAKDGESNKLQENYNNKLNEANEHNNMLKDKIHKLEENLEKIITAYAKIKADMYGLDSKLILENVRNNSLEEINRLTESYNQQKLTESKLPFTASQLNKAQYTRSNNNIIKYSNNTHSDDISLDEIESFSDLNY